MTLAVYLLVFLGLLAGTGVVNWLLGFRYSDDMTPLPVGRILVTQGRNTFHCDTQEQAQALADSYDGFTLIHRRPR